MNREKTSGILDGFKKKLPAESHDMAIKRYIDSVNNNPSVNGTDNQAQDNLLRHNNLEYFSKGVQNDFDVKIPFNQSIVKTEYSQGYDPNGPSATLPMYAKSNGMPGYFEDLGYNPNGASATIPGYAGTGKDLIHEKGKILFDQGYNPNGQSSTIPSYAGVGSGTSDIDAWKERALSDKGFIAENAWRLHDPASLGLGAAGLVGAGLLGYGAYKTLRRKKTAGKMNEIENKKTEVNRMDERTYGRIKTAAAMGNVEAQNVVLKVEGTGMAPIVKSAALGDPVCQEFLDNFEKVFGAGSVKQAFLNETYQGAKETANSVAGSASDAYQGAVDFMHHPIDNTADYLGDTARHASNYADRVYGDVADDFYDVANGGQNTYIDRAGDALRHAGNIANRYYGDAADYLGDSYAANPIGTVAAGAGAAAGLGAAGYGAYKGVQALRRR